MEKQNETENISNLRKRKQTSNSEDVTKISSPKIENNEEEIPIYIPIIRNILVLVIFSILFYFYQTFIFKPIFHPEPTIDYSKITEQVCPQGVDECNFQLKENWQQLIQNAVRQ